MKRLLAAIGFLFLTASPAVAQQNMPHRTEWHYIATPHFHVYHESDWTPQGISVELEKIYGYLRIHMGIFAPWMLREKVNIYIYKDRQSFAAGEFAPPSWSRGLAIFQKKTIVIFNDHDSDNLRSVITHELTHLFFESFFGEMAKYPPLWLNEGVAVMMEDTFSNPKGDKWSAALKMMSQDRIQRFPQFLNTQLDKDSSKQSVSDWYLQAYGMVFYLFYDKRLQFKNFCYMLRSGVDVNQALWNVYRLKNLDGFEQEWRKWVGAEKTLQRVDSFGGNIQFRQIRSFSEPSQRQQNE